MITILVIVTFSYRTYLQQSPTDREILDSVSNLNTQIVLSLKSGVIRRSKFSVCFRRDVFNYLFKVNVLVVNVVKCMIGTILI